MFDKRWRCTLRTFQTICGKSVFDQTNGVELGKIEDLFINKQGQVIGFVLDIKAWLHKDQFVPLDAITGFGPDGIIIKGKKHLTRADHIHEYTLKQGKKRIAGMPLLTVEGEKLGLVEDVYFMEEMGNIVGYEVTEGLLADIKEGKKVVRTSKPLLYGKDILMINLE